MTLIAVRTIGGSDDSATDRQGSANAVGAPSSDLLYMRVNSNPQLLEFDTRTGTSKFLPIDLPCGDTPFCLIPSGNGVVISGVGRTTLYSPTDSGKPRDRHIGNGWITVPAEGANSVWLGILGKDQENVRTRDLSSVREIDLQGEVLRTMRPPNGSWPVEAVEDGLLFQGRQQLRLWNLNQSRFTRKLTGRFPAATSGDLVASCDYPCPRIVLTDLSSGEVSRLKPPTGYEWTGGYDGAFSPSGTLLAAPVTSSGARPRVKGLAIANLETQTSEFVPGSGGMDWYTAMAWSSSGDRLFYPARFPSRIASYEPSAERSVSVGELPLEGDASPRARVIELVAVPTD